VITTELFGTLPDGRVVNQYMLTNETGITVKLLNYGGIIRAIQVPDRNGVSANIVLSYDTLEDYIQNPPFLGALIGPTAGRIRGGDLDIDGVHYSIPQNNGENALHGGPFGFHNQWMEAVTSEDEESMALRLSFVLENKGYPGTLRITMGYTLMKRENRFILSFEGDSDQKTYLNMTNHSYFNLSGLNKTIENHLLCLNADGYAPVDEAMLPSVGWSSVNGTPFDMRRSVRVGDAIHSEHEQIQIAGGVDHPFRLIRNAEDSALVRGARLEDSVSGRTLDVSTTQPHMVIYTGNFLHQGTVPSGKAFQRFQGICFEAQEVPDAPGNTHFECTYLNVGEKYHQLIQYEFGLNC